MEDEVRHRVLAPRRPDRLNHLLAEVRRAQRGALRPVCVTANILKIGGAVLGLRLGGLGA